MLSEEEKQKRLENYRKKKEKLSEEEIKTKEKKQNLLARIKIQRDKIKKSENKQKEIRDAKDMELVKMLRDIHGEEDIDNDRVKNIGAVIKYHNKSFLTAFFKIFYFVIFLSKLP